MKINKWTVFFCILSVLATGFIFYNSMQDAVTSEERSLAIVEQVKPILDADNSMTKKAFNDMIRALAHLAEFAMLGFSLGGMLCSMQGRMDVKTIRNALLIALTVAIADEILQHFTGRFTDVKDVAMDVLGAFAGVMIVKIGNGMKRYLATFRLT